MMQHTSLAVSGGFANDLALEEDYIGGVFYLALKKTEDVWLAGHESPSLP